MSRFYEDLAKEPKDLVEKGFPSNGTLKVTVETKTPNGIGLTATALRTLKTKGDKQQEVVSAGVEPKFDWKANNVDFSSKLNTSNAFESEIGFRDIAAPGTKLSFKGVQDENGHSTSGALSFKNDNVALKTTVSYPFSSKRPIKLSFNTVFRHNRYLLGIDTTYDTPFEKDDETRGKPANVDASTSAGATVAYLGDGYEAHLTLKNFPVKKDRDNEVGFTWFQKVSESVRLAVNFTVDQSNTKGPNTVVVGDYKLDDVTIVKGKMAVKSSEYRVGLGATQKLSSHLTATVGADLNVLKLLGNNAGADPSFGLEVKFNV